MTPTSPIRKTLIAGSLAFGSTIALVAGITTSFTPASAQLAVFDPHNHSQNLLTAARTLTQVNNQIRSLQNQAQSLINQAKNLTKRS